MRVLVLGAGVVGVSTAWFLARAGHDVTVVDRQSQAANETSFANGGQLSVSQSEPWASPHAPLLALKWLWREDAPLLFRWRLDPQQWEWGLRFLWECRQQRQQNNIRAMLQIGLYSRAAFAELDASLALDYQRRSQGIICLYDQQQELDQAAQIAHFMQQYGVERQVLSTAQLIEIEPALKHCAQRLVGGTYCATDASGNVRLFTRALAEQARQQGVTFLFGHRINALEAGGDGRISAVSVTNAEGHYQALHADAYVLALGSFSPLIAATVGVRLPIYPAKGYSATVNITRPDAAPEVSMTDEAAKVVFSRLGDQLRIAGTAEFSGYSHHLNPVRCQALLQVARAWFPEAADYDHPQFWSGLRPSTPSNVPFIGRAKGWHNLFLNTGHGTLGWTQGPGSGKALAEIISGHRPACDFPFTGL